MNKPLITSNEQLKEFCAQLQANIGISIDTEFMRQKTYFAIPAVLQISQVTAHDNNNEKLISACIDAPLISDWSPLQTAIEQASHCLAHSPDQDFEIFDQLFDDWNFTIYDTQIAMALLGEQTQISYAQMIKLNLDIEIDKSQSRTDWLRRPLSQAQLEYALADVIHLPNAWKHLKRKLIEKDRLDWFLADCSRQVKRYKNSRNNKNAWRSVKGIKNLSGREFAIAASIAQWREEQAIESDLPRRWMLSDEVILELALEPNVLTALLDRWSILRKHTDKVAELIDQPMEIFLNTDTKAFLPLTNEEKTKFKKLKQYCIDQSNKLQVDSAAIANRKTLEKIVRGSYSFLSSENWRHQILLNYIHENN